MLLPKKLNIKTVISYKKFKLIAGGLATGLSVSLFAYYSVSLYNFSQKNNISFRSPLILQTPVVIEERTPEVQYIEVVKQSLKPTNSIEEKICQKFGAECEIALAVMKAESGGNPLAYNINTNNSFDFGLFQINSIHYKKEICSIDKVITVEGNIDCAYSIYEAQGFSPWVAYSNGAYQKYLAYERN